jgi:hypothetical protein
MAKNDAIKAQISLAMTTMAMAVAFSAIDSETTILALRKFMIS